MQLHHPQQDPRRDPSGGLHCFLPGKSGHGAFGCHGQGNDTFRISAGYHPHAECRHPRCHVAGDRR